MFFFIYWWPWSGGNIDYYSETVAAAAAATRRVAKISDGMGMPIVKAAIVLSPLRRLKPTDNNKRRLMRKLHFSLHLFCLLIDFKKGNTGTRGCCYNKTFFLNSGFILWWSYGIFQLYKQVVVIAFVGLGPIEIEYSVPGQRCGYHRRLLLLCKRTSWTAISAIVHLR